MTAAAAAADAALVDVEPMLFATVDSPVTEADIRNELEYRMRLHGADDRSYETIVAAGPEHGARPHHEPSGRRIVEGDTVIIDVGALVDGYHSDMTRSYVIGEPTPQQRELYELVSRIRSAPASMRSPARPAGPHDRPGEPRRVRRGRVRRLVPPRDRATVSASRSTSDRSTRSSSDDAIQVGNVVTVEPGLYRVGFGGFRIEDLLVVTEHGSLRLTHAPERPFN